MAVEVIASRVACHGEAWQRAGIWLVRPGDLEWPSQLEVMGDGAAVGPDGIQIHPGHGDEVPPRLLLRHEVVIHA